MRAPGGPGAAIRWGPGRKQAFGAAPGPADRSVPRSEPPTLCAHQGGSWVSIVGPFTRGTAGYLNSSDLFVDLHDNDGEMTAEYEAAEAGSVALGAEIGFREGSFQL